MVWPRRNRSRGTNEFVIVSGNSLGMAVAWSDMLIAVPITENIFSSNKGEIS
jgi:hypothetical protein